ncbi:hypothetical protein NM208_g3240 [Fusarium decemcellulare]|uniref:Uncharacterized protein n=1 Tax=Fusarium decemcellulare TaxID=57161 RepID=A0ACC1SQ38_9HYPO|nr:hypothetical protein NM208_g3240 [Fusarium decemcellulare]
MAAFLFAMSIAKDRGGISALNSDYELQYKATWNISERVSPWWTKGSFIWRDKRVLEDPDGAAKRGPAFGAGAAPDASGGSGCDPAIVNCCTRPMDMIEHLVDVNIALET